MTIAFGTSYQQASTWTSFTSGEYAWALSAPDSGSTALVIATAFFGTTDNFYRVRYNGRYLTHIGKEVFDNLTEPCSVDLWLYSDPDDFPTSQTDVIFEGQGTTTKFAYAVFLTEDTGKRIKWVNGVFAYKEQNQADPSVTLDTGSVVAARLAILYTGASAPATTLASNCTNLQTADHGAFATQLIKYDNITSGSTTIGATLASDDVAMAGAAFQAVDSGSEVWGVDLGAHGEYGTTSGTSSRTFAFKAGRVYTCVAFQGGSGTTTPTISGSTSGTWTHKYSEYFAADTRHLSLHHYKPSSNHTEAISFTGDSNTGQWSFYIMEWRDTKTTGTNGADALVNADGNVYSTVNSMSITLPALAATGNAGVGVGRPTMFTLDEQITVEGGASGHVWDRTNDFGSASHAAGGRTVTVWNTDDNTVSLTWTTIGSSGSWLLAWEMAKATGGGGPALSWDSIGAIPLGF